MTGSAIGHRVRAGERPGDCYAYGTSAFRNALTDANMTRGQIDGLIVGPTTAYERMAEVLNMNVRWGDQADAVLSVVQACMAIESGMADVVALVYGNDQRSVGTQYGGPQAMGGGSVPVLRLSRAMGHDFAGRALCADVPPLRRALRHQRA